MVRRFSILTVMIATIAACTIDVFACGDKFLRVGRSPRVRAYASKHPSTVLVYAPRWTRSGIGEFEQMLKRAGHKPATVTTPAGIVQAFGAVRYDVVITGYSDTAAVKNELDALHASPALLPIVYRASKAEAAEAAARYTCLLKPESMTAFQALEEIDHLLDRHLKDRVQSSR